MDHGEGIMANLRTAGGSRAHPPPLRVEVSHDLVLAYRKEAARRDVSVQRLVAELLDRIAGDQLTSAILDDGGDLPVA
jgi:hypothetical protein